VRRDISKILIVDDDAENGRFLEEELANPFCRATWFQDPREALRHFRRGRYNVGILDLKMPHMDGVELFRTLREKDSEIGLIILTGYPTVDSALATLKTGAYDYVKKPYRIEELEAIVRRLLESKGFSFETEGHINRAIGKRIKNYRIHHRWTLAELAKKTHLSKSLISQLENGKNSASLQTLSKISRSLKIRVADLVQDI
jgi:DNA-binding response OmpR family regulator